MWHACAPDRQTPGISLTRLPDNFRHIGVIRLALPKAKVVYCRRSAADTCVSIYNLNFFSNAVSYGYDLNELGDYYRQHVALMAHWQKLLPNFVFTNQYETLVENLEGQTRRLLAFCGLDWDDSVLRFHENSRRVQTASATQVRRPIYSSSVGRYKRYGPAVQPLLDALGWDEETGDIRL